MAFASARPCQVLHSHWTVAGGSTGGKAALMHWVCPIEDGPPQDTAPAEPENPAVAVVAAVERLCSKYFPPGGGKATIVGDMTAVHYRDTDMRLYVESTGGVCYRHMRTVDPTRFAEASILLEGTARLDCDWIEGRYVPPWLRG